MTILNPFFGEFGGQYVPQLLIPVLDKLLIVGDLVHMRPHIFQHFILLAFLPHNKRTPIWSLFMPSQPYQFEIL